MVRRSGITQTARGILAYVCSPFCVRGSWFLFSARFVFGVRFHVRFERSGSRRALMFDAPLAWYPDARDRNLCTRRARNPAGFSWQLSRRGRDGHRRHRTRRSRVYRCRARPAAPTRTRRAGRGASESTRAKTTTEQCPMLKAQCRMLNEDRSVVVHHSRTVSACSQVVWTELGIGH